MLEILNLLLFGYFAYFYIQSNKYFPFFFEVLVNFY